MNPSRRRSGPVVLSAAALVLFVLALPHAARAGFPWKGWWHKAPAAGCPAESGVGGEWHWLRSPEQEQRVVIGQYNRYCVRCHGVDGRGVWDIPDVPDFANARLAGAPARTANSSAPPSRAAAPCMPPFRGTLTLEEAWAMARYLRTFVPGTEQPRPDRPRRRRRRGQAPASNRRPARRSDVLPNRP